MASYRSASSSEIVSIRILACGMRSLMVWVASMPLRRGMRTSISTTSGMSSWAFSMASEPSPASPPPDLDVVLLLEHHLEPTAEQRVVVHDQHADGITCAPRSRLPVVGHA